MIPNTGFIKHYSKMHSNIVLCAVVLILGGNPCKYDIVDALSSSSISKKLDLSDLKIEESTFKPESIASSGASATSFPISRAQQKYFTAFVNLSYVHYDKNNSRPNYHTDHSETGRYSTADHSDVHGVAIQMISKRSELTSSSNDSEPSDSDITGCYPPFLDNYPRNESWIAIVKRGHCTFNEKIKNALDLNASGVLVYDNEDGKPLQSMKGMIKYYYSY